MRIAAKTPGVRRVGIVAHRMRSRIGASEFAEPLYNDDLEGDIIEDVDDIEVVDGNAWTDDADDSNVVY